MKIVAIIQARMGSTRLPGKVLIQFAGKPAIQHVVDRARAIPSVSEIIVATSDHPKDDPLARFCTQENIPVYRGSESDVLDRYYQTALKVNADIIVRITGDCPLLDPTESERVIQTLISTQSDFVTNANPPTLPDGLDTSAFTMGTLKKVWDSANAPEEREHVTLYIYNNPDDFEIEKVVSKKDYSDYRFTLDRPEDRESLTKIFDILNKNNKYGYLSELITIVNENKDIFELTMNIQRNEGLKIQ